MPTPLFLPRALVVLAAFTAPASALPALQPPTRADAPAALSAIREADLKRDLYAMAGDAMRGREAGTPDEMRASMWVAEQLRMIGVKPMGDDGSYFQWFNMIRTRVSTVSTTASFNGTEAQLFRDFIPLGAANAEAMLRGAAPVAVQLRLERFETPSVNIVGRIEGTDRVLSKEYVLFSSHQDHDGVRYAIDGDSVWAGADDNGTVSVALLASARAFIKQRPKRSVLFVYHGAEERGLLGSRYHAAHPVVPLSQIVTVLNGDMIGRNHPDSASILGVQPPHRNSSDLVAHALRANALTGRFKLDSIWDRPSHPEGWYFRSDHVPYARLNVPALMYTTNLHPDYHTPRDKPDRIDYPKLTRMAQWMYLTGWFVANAPKRPAVDPGFKLER